MGSEGLTTFTLYAEALDPDVTLTGGREGFMLSKYIRISASPVDFWRSLSASKLVGVEDSTHQMKERVRERSVTSPNSRVT